MADYLLSKQGELLLKAIQDSSAVNGWCFEVHVPENINRDSAVSELEIGGYIISPVVAGIDSIQCTLTPKGETYFVQRPTLQYKEAMEMFVPLPQELKEDLKQITTEYKDGDYIRADSEIGQVVDKLKNAGYLKGFGRHIRNHVVKFSYEDLHYDFLEEQHNKPFIPPNNIIVYGGNNQLNTATGNATINSVQNNGIDAVTLNKLIADVLESAPKDDDEQLEMIADSLEEIRNQAMANAPKKGIIKALFTGLNGIANCAGFAANVAALYQFLQASGIL